jgi:hypothetical protein
MGLSVLECVPRIGLPGIDILHFGRCFADDFPSQKLTRLPQRACVYISKCHQIFRLEHYNEIGVVASDHYTSPRLTRAIDDIEGY